MRILNCFCLAAIAVLAWAGAAVASFAAAVVDLVHVAFPAPPPRTPWRLIAATEAIVQGVQLARTRAFEDRLLQRRHDRGALALPQLA